MRFFFPQDSFHKELVNQGLNEWINYPEVDEDVPGLLAARATIAPGKGHNFHAHPGRQEIIYVLGGAIEQWVGETRQTLRAGDAVLIPAGHVHASFNAGAGPAVLFVVLTPAVSEEPLGIDMSNEAPWNALRRPLPNDPSPRS